MQRHAPDLVTDRARRVLVNLLEGFSWQSSGIEGGRSNGGASWRSQFVPMPEGDQAVPGDPSARQAADGRASDRRISLEHQIVILLLADLALLLFCGLLPGLADEYVGLNLGSETDQFIAVLVGMAIFLLVGRVVRLYQTRRVLDHRAGLRRLGITLLATFALLMTIGVATKTSASYSRIWFFSWMGLACLTTLFVRYWLVRAARRKIDRGAFVYKALSVGLFCPPLSAQEIARTSDGLVLTTEAVRLSGPSELPDLVDRIRYEEIDQVYLAVPWVDAPLAFDRLQDLRHLAAEIFVLPHEHRIRSNQIAVSRFGDQLSLVAGDRPIDGWDLWAKRAQDILVSSAILIVASPLLAAIALAIRLDSRGPVLFRQRRVGFNGKTFELLKFRSMYFEMGDADAFRQTSRNDDRVTRVGRFIRRTSLDELPQFINVLQGSMSVVGPRPHALQTRTEGRPLEEMAERYAARHRVKPGLTGLAQVRGFRGELDSIKKLKRRVAYDIEYIENWSTWLDIKIILRTALLIVRDPAAY